MRRGESPALVIEYARTMHWESLIWVGAGLVLLAPRAFLLLRGHINVHLFGEVLAKLVRAGDLDRALRLCAAAPHSFYVQIARPMLEAAEQSKASGDALLRERVRDAFDTERPRQLARIRAHRWTLAAAVVAAVVGALLAIAADPSQDYVLLGSFAVVGLVLLDRRKVRAFERDSRSAGEQLLALLTESDSGRRDAAQR
jgi:biopolymer transport protein ExbB